LAVADQIVILLGAELDHGQAIATGLSEDVQPFVKPLETHKLDDEDKAATEQESGTNWGRQGRQSVDSAAG